MKETIKYKCIYIIFDSNRWNVQGEAGSVGGDARVGFIILRLMSISRADPEFTLFLATPVNSA